MADQSANREFRELEPSNLLPDLLALITERLPDFVDSDAFKKVLSTKRNEPLYSTAFSLFMMQGQDKFTFINELKQKGAHSVDFGVYDKASDMIFIIEAKRLPTPRGSKKNPRAESEYVYTQDEKGAGIQRFRTGDHGLNHQGHFLPECGMLGYVEHNDFDHWIKTINGWIVQAHWPETEQLEPIITQKVARLKSTHSRKQQGQIIIHHFWAYVKKEPKSNPAAPNQ